MNTNTDTDTVFWNPTITWSQKNQWCSVNDFTDAQGANQWYYEYSDTADVYYAMNYSSGDLCFKGPEDINRVGANIQHPGEVYRSIRKWIAPRNGNINISAWAKLYTLGGDGVTIEILKNGTLYWGERYWGQETLLAQTLLTSTSGMSTNCSTSVHAGDVIYFIVSKNGTTIYDSTEWNSIIAYY